MQPARSFYRRRKTIRIYIRASERAYAREELASAAALFHAARCNAESARKSIWLILERRPRRCSNYRALLPAGFCSRLVSSSPLLRVRVKTSRERSSRPLMTILFPPRQTIPCLVRDFRSLDNVRFGRHSLRGRSIKRD